VAAFDNYLTPGFDLDLPYQIQSNPSPLYSASTVSDFTIVGDQQLTPPNYIHDVSPRSSKKHKAVGQERHKRGWEKPANSMAVNDGAADAADNAAANKPKRVRTGCLTCRERHLKCDEGLPNCQNCRKSSRECKRGVRLNFIDIQEKCKYILPPTSDWKGLFHIESH
jgi:hypothetical protein